MRELNIKFGSSGELLRPRQTKHVQQALPLALRAARHAPELCTVWLSVASALWPPVEYFTLSLSDISPRLPAARPLAYDPQICHERRRNPLSFATFGCLPVLEVLSTPGAVRAQ